MTARRASFVLVHGAWHGGWCWRRVEDRLTAKHRYVVAPTLSGVCERSHLANDVIDLTTHINRATGFPSPTFDAKLAALLEKLA